MYHCISTLQKLNVFSIYKHKIRKKYLKNFHASFFTQYNRFKIRLYWFFVLFYWILISLRQNKESVFWNKVLISQSITKQNKKLLLHRKNIVWDEKNSVFGNIDVCLRAFFRTRAAAFHEDGLRSSDYAKSHRSFAFARLDCVRLSCG